VLVRKAIVLCSVSNY